MNKLFTLAFLLIFITGCSPSMTFADYFRGLSPFSIIVNGVLLLVWLLYLYIFVREIQRQYKITYRGLLAAFILLVSSLVLFNAWVHRVSSYPLDESISIEPPGKVETYIRIPIKTKYSLYLVFERAGHPFEELKALIGDFTGPGPSGVHVPIRWSVNALTPQKPIASGDVDSFGANAWSKDRVERFVGIIEADPGQYLFRAEITHGVPELAHVLTRVSLQPAHDAGGWQFGLVWWGSFVSYLLDRLHLL
jgi:hypothetical protein